jgi:superfamily II DNA or RNA helicase
VSIAVDLQEWLGAESPIGQAVERYSKDCLNTYKVDRRRVTEDANGERFAIEGGYARRQLEELIQNGADELIDRRGRIELVLTEEALYCANEGRPVTTEGVGALLGSHNSPKKGVEIGRFGLGFKSVLGVSTKPAVFSKTGSFQFDRAYNLERVRRVVPDAERVATLRIARPLSPVKAAAEDPILEQLMSWADTVVYLPRDIAGTEWLSDRFRAFPREFLLFSTHVSQLVLDDRVAAHRRVIELTQDEDRWTLEEHGDEAGSRSWRVFAREHRPSPGVKDDGGTMADRDRLPVNWAVPLDRAPLGQIWAFFPTREQTTLSGVLNAPWKLNEDRTGLIEGPFNEELLRVVVQMVIANLEAVHSVDDPGYLLSVLPARGRELRGWADGVLSDQVYERIVTAACIPDQRGRLARPAELNLHPPSVPLAALELWAEQPKRPTDWVHPSAVRNDTRRSRVERLMQAAAVSPASVQDWLEVLAMSRTGAKGSASAIKVAAELLRSDLETDMRSAKIVLTTSGSMVSPRRGTVYLPGPVEVDVKVAIVHPEVVADEDARAALVELGITEVSPATVLEALLERAVLPEYTVEWETVWRLVRQVGDSESKRLILHSGLDSSELMVRTLAETWAPLNTVLLPGDLLSKEDFGGKQQSLLIDADYHRVELPVLRALGATDRPVAGAGSPEEPWVADYIAKEIRKAVEDGRRHGARIKPEHFSLSDPPAFGGPVTPLAVLKPEAAARYAKELLAVSPDLSPWTLQKVGGRSAEPRELEHPLLRKVKEIGLLPTDRGVRPIADCISPLLKDFADLLPVADLPRHASRALQLPDTVSELDEPRIRVAMARVDQLDREDLLGPTYLKLLPHLASPPETMRAVVRREVKSVPRGQVCAAVSIQDVKVLRGTGAPFIRVPDEDAASRLIGVWGLLSVTDAVSSKIAMTPDGPGEPLCDVFPLLRHVLGPDAEPLELVPCKELRRELYTEHGSITEELSFELRDGVVYRVADLADEEVLRLLSERLGTPLSGTEIDEVIKNAQAAEVQALLRRVRARETDAERLLELVGAEELRMRLPRELVEAVEETDGELDGIATAELALNVFGVETLKEYRDALLLRGLNPPKSWAGSRAAIRFVVEELGFERKYAGFAEMRLEETLDVPGPSPLPELHPFQRRSADEIHRLLRGEGGLRGLLSLPTGAGKTRVAVQALVEAMAGGGLRSPVLWIAQTEELCEQAVQSWAEVWRAEGPDRALRLSRLWGGHSAQPREDDGDQVVVSTIDKLVDRCVDDPAFEWVSTATCVVIDEAHTSITPSYTRLLRWLGMEAGKERAPLIGLSATPFRGVSEEETERLVNRYNRRRLDRNAFDEEVSIPLLQDMDVLARVEHQILEGSSVPLTSAELEEINRMRRLPASVLTRIGEDIDRTNRLVESIMGLDPDWPVLLFATSVSHAATVAALLSRRGRSAAAVSGQTPTAVRRHLISEFRAGRLRTLTNYGVLTQGFDAPSIRALYIARPTYSPNLYQQMIGRGLRGPANGGKECCLVVDVADNLAVHGAELAFREFEYLWTD